MEICPEDTLKIRKILQAIIDSNYNPEIKTCLIKLACPDIGIEDLDGNKKRNIDLVEEALSAGEKMCL